MEIPVKLLVKLSRFFFGRSAGRNLGAAWWKETGANSPSFFFVWWLVMVLVQKTGNPKSSGFLRINNFFWGGFTMVFFFQRTRPQQNFHPQIFLQRSVTKEKLPLKTKEKNPRNFDEVQVVASKRDVDGYLEAPTNFEQWKKNGPLVVVEGFFYRGGKTTHVCGNYSKPL